MNEHEYIREILTLAAAGALDDAGERRVQNHLRQCADCRAELAAWQRLTGALEAMPTPQAPVGLVERTRRQVARKAAARAEHGRTRNLLVWLTVFAWATTSVSWLCFRWIGNRLATEFGVSSTGLVTAWITYTLAAWLTTVLAAGLLAQRSRKEGLYEPLF